MNKYFIEQINVSDNEYLITSILFQNGDKVNKGEVIFSYESSKADFDGESDHEGYIYYNPTLALRKNYKIGYLLAVVSEDQITDFSNIFTENNSTEPESGIDINQDRIITKKAQKLIEENNIDPGVFTEEIVSEEIVSDYLSKNRKHTFQDIGFYYSGILDFKINSGKKRLAIIGAGKAALQLLDTVFELKNINPVVLYDGNQDIIGKQLLGIDIKQLSIENIIKDFKDQVFDEIIISFSGNITERKKWFDLLKENDLSIANIFHPTCIISNFVNLGEGNIFFANTRIGPFVEIGNNNVVSSYCSFEHHNKLGNHNTFGPSVIFSGSCTIEDEIKFGTGIFIEPRVTIESNSIIASGCIVQRNIPAHSILRNTTKFEIKKINTGE
ncbi:acetyltransferase [Chryseobacterium profundimaris]|uniref:Acetyltransferase (Isoleucine patch superfamily) n=1 Tax=Chryseobacterium profundimaris TaxID=1387275 RepID=A0ABY1PDF4_9FLAO|nr:acetyltransferase [Chryseobacterium profundimaris]SMP31780.1 Acetyltransferase (isoleucine patch superfamily) [Chryseobacterium profundimaris]